jgi:DNA-binding MarR family transcriptional regulator
MTSPRLTSMLNGADLGTWAALATLLEWLPPALDEQLVAEFDLTHFEYGVLYALADAPDRTLRLSVLAGYANSTLSRLSRAVSRLERRGLVERSPDPSDGRSTRATLTEAGATVFDEATPGHEQTVARLVLDPLTTTQKRHLREITRRLQTAIREERGWHPPAAVDAPTPQPRR